MKQIAYCYIKETYYDIHENLQKILDMDDIEKHKARTHLCLSVQHEGYYVLIPLRKNLGLAERKFGKIGFALPTQTKPNAGLDYRYIMIIEDVEYLIFDTPRIPAVQMKTIAEKYDRIEQEAIEYIDAYIRKAKKNRAQSTARFRESSLVNFHAILGVPLHKHI